MCCAPLWRGFDFPAADSLTCGNGECLTYTVQVVMRLFRCPVVDVPPIPLVLDVFSALVTQLVGEFNLFIGVGFVQGQATLCGIWG